MLNLVNVIGAILVVLGFVALGFSAVAKEKGWNLWSWVLLFLACCLSGLAGICSFHFAEIPGPEILF